MSEATQRTYGVWNGRGWISDHLGHLYISNTRAGAAAKAHNVNSQISGDPVTVEEIRDDGLPIKRDVER